MRSFIIKDPYLIGITARGQAYERYRELWKKAGQKAYHGRVPIHIDFDTIDACNASCIICHDAGRKRTGKKIEVSVAKSLIDEGAGQGLCSVNIGGCAEPYMAKDLLLEIAAHAASRQLLDIFIHSNFQIATPEAIQETIEAGVNYICVAVDAISKDTYRAIRGGDFGVVLENLKFISQYKKTNKLAYPIVRVSAVPCLENRHELPRLAEFWSPHANVVEIQGYLSDPSHKTKGRVATGKTTDCSSPWKRLFIWPHGDVGACCLKMSLGEDVCLGNIYKENKSLQEFWTGERIQRIRQAIISKEWDQIPTCWSCMSRTYTLVDSDLCD